MTQTDSQEKPGGVPWDAVGLLLFDLAALACIALLFLAVWGL